MLFRSTEDNAIKAVCDDVEIEIPSGMIETEVDNMVKDVEQRLKYQGLTLEQYYSLSGKPETVVRDEMKETAKNNVKSRLVIEAIIKAEDIKPDDKEVDEKLKEMAKNYNKTEEEMKENSYLKEYITENIKVNVLKNCIISLEKLLKK